MGNNHAQWTGYTNVEMFAEERNMAVVMISGENKFYHDSLDGEPFFDFVAKEVPEFVTNYFPISAEPEHSYIAGLSMGGYGALLHGLSNPVCSDWFLLRRSHAGGRSGKSGRSD
jgi:putative tributyrin esterase